MVVITIRTMYNVHGKMCSHHAVQKNGTKVIIIVQFLNLNYIKKIYYNM